jgi:aromatic-L-amino-acid/L-tryptophan decarboxylase
MNDKTEYSLDPENWQDLRALGHQMLDDMFEHLENIRETPVWQPVPETVKESFKTSLPHEGRPEAEIYAEFQKTILPYQLGNLHPRFWGWVMTTGSPLGMLAEMLTGGLTTQMGGGEHSGVYVELQVLDWFKELFGYPSTAGGILVSGASMANLVGLTVARNTKAPFDIRKEGLQSEHPKMVLYASSEVHSCHQKNTELLGLGSSALRYIPVDDNYAMDLKALREAIAADKAAGYLPFCVIGTAGTVKTGAFDDIQALAEICAKEDLWLHVDGAFGAMVAMSEEAELKALIAGMELADSIGFDMHKWMSVPFEAACALVKDGKAHYKAFTLTPDYLTHASRGAASAQTWLSDYGIQLSRSFRALKVWMALKVHGADFFGKVIAMNVEQARYLAQLVDAAPQLERTAPVPLNIVCFRYVQEGISDEALNALNEELLIRLQESGSALVSNATLHGKYSLRMANVNHRSSYDDFDVLVQTVIQLGEELIRTEEYS